MAQQDPSDPSVSPLPPGATPIEYAVYSIHEMDGGAAIPPAGGGSDIVLARPLTDGELIDSPEDYLKVFKKPPQDIDWSSRRLYVVEESTTYKLGSIESRSSLSGVYQTADALYIGQTWAHLGPCQGIAQLPEWFSYHLRYLVLLIPRVPEKIVRFDIQSGGCPPDIP